MGVCVFSRLEQTPIIEDLNLGNRCWPGREPGSVLPTLGFLLPRPVVQSYCPGPSPWGGSGASGRALCRPPPHPPALPALGPWSWAAHKPPRGFLNDIPSVSAQGLWLFCLFPFFLSYFRSSRELKSKPLKAKHF